MKGVDPHSLSVDAVFDLPVCLEPLTDEVRRGLQETIDARLGYQAVVGVFGSSGSGKSSLCNALSGKDECEVFVPEGIEKTISAAVDSGNQYVVPCTRYPQEITLAYRNNCGLSLIDTPGFGSYQKKDKAQSALYRDLLPELDLILWVVRADDLTSGTGIAADLRTYQECLQPLVQAMGIPVLLVLNMNDLPVQQACGFASDIDDNQGLPVDLLHGSRETVCSSIPACCQAMMIPLSQICLISNTGNIGLISLLEKTLRFLPIGRKGQALLQQKEFPAVHQDTQSIQLVPDNF